MEKTPLQMQITRCAEEWGRTLKHFGCERGLMPNEMMAIGRAVQAHGEPAVLLAFSGARMEKKSERFDPADYLSLSRVLRADCFDRFVNLGTKAMNAENKRKIAENVKDPEVIEPADPARVRALLAGLFGRVPK